MEEVDQYIYEFRIKRTKDQAQNHHGLAGCLESKSRIPRPEYPNCGGIEEMITDEQGKV